MMCIHRPRRNAFLDALGIALLVLSGIALVGGAWDGAVFFAISAGAGFFAAAPDTKNHDLIT